MAWWRIALVAVLVACNAGEEDAQAPAPCAPPNRVVDERCLEPGVQDNGCPAGALAFEGGCRPAGVPAELCAEGFVHDGDAACEPILPPDACPESQMALPGESECHPVMDCGAGAWGDIPVDGASIYVDASYAGGDSDGTSSKPWTTISEAIAAAPAGALIAIAAGSYLESFDIDQPLRLWGVCPDRVELVGTGTAPAALLVRSGASGSEVRGVAITGQGAGIVVSGAEDVVLERLWVHDTMSRGVNVQDTLGPTSVVLLASLVERSADTGVFVAGAAATIEDVVVRGTLNAAGARGVGIQTSSDTDAPATALVRRALIEQNYEVGVYVGGADATFEGVVVRHSSATNDGGHGFTIHSSSYTGAASKAVVRGALVEANRAVGVAVSGSEATLEGVVVRGTLPRSTDGRAGVGIAVLLDENMVPGSAVVTSSLVEQNREVGVAISGANATLEGVLVRETSPGTVNVFGIGVGVQPWPDSGAPANAVLRASVIEQSVAFGVLVNGVTATLDGIVVRGTIPNVFDGSFGDGVTIAHRVHWNGTGLFASGVIKNSRIEQNARAGLANFGAQLGLGSSALACNAFDLDGETFLEQPYFFDNLDGNGCGCPAAQDACAARTSGLAPPPSL